MDSLDIASDAIDLFLEYRDKHGYDEIHAKVKALGGIMKAIDIASDAIDLFLEYRDKHGYDEIHAKVKALSTPPVN